MSEFSVKCVAPRAAALDCPLEFTLRWLRSTNHASGFNRYLAKSQYAQLAHWAFVTHTTVVNHCWRTRLVNVLSAFFGFSNPFILEKKNHLNKTIKSLFLFYPIHVTLESWISHDWSHHRYILTPPQFAVSCPIYLCSCPMYLCSCTY